MTWSYTDPSASARDAVRFMIGDVDTADQQLSNEEIDFVLSETGSSATREAAAHCCDALQARYARMVNMAVGDLRQDYSDRVKQYAALAVTLRSRAAVAAAPYIGGTSIADNEALDANEDRPPRDVSRGMHDNPEADRDPNASDDE